MRWQEKKVLVTGATGFVGSHLTERLLTLGADVRAFLHYNSRGDIGNLRWLSSDLRHAMECFSGDLKVLETVRKAMKGVDVVFHLGALVSIPYSYHHPHDVMETNTRGTMNILSSARDESVERIVHTSTSEVYGSALRVPMNERHPKQAQSPYAASKNAADGFALAFHDSYDLPVTVIRPFNTYGPRQSDRAVIPSIISQALTKNEIALGDCSPTRDFTYVSDLIQAYLRIAEVDEAVGKEINIGSGEEISIGDLAATIIRLIGNEVSVVQDRERFRPARSEVTRLLADPGLAAQTLDWRVSTPMQQGLRLTIDWIRDRPSHYRPDRYNF